MTLFADTLKKYLETKNTTIYTISKISGVDRTMIQHMKVGKRMPANVADVTAIAKAMMLNPSETAELLRAYHISHMGEENHLRFLRYEFCRRACDSHRRTGYARYAGTIKNYQRSG